MTGQATPSVAQPVRRRTSCPPVMPPCDLAGIVQLSEVRGAVHGLAHPDSDILSSCDADLRSCGVVSIGTGDAVRGLAHPGSDFLSSRDAGV